MGEWIELTKLCGPIVYIGRIYLGRERGHMKWGDAVIKFDSDIFHYFVD